MYFTNETIMNIQQTNVELDELAQLKAELQVHSKALFDINKKLDERYGLRVKQSIQNAAATVIDAELEVLKVEARLQNAFADLDD